MKLSKKNKIFVSIIVPSYNESADVKRNGLEQLDNFLKNQNYTYEVLIIDDKSTNNTLNLVKESIKAKKNFRIIENEHGGKAITVMTGLLASKGSIALFTDMDQATPISELTKLLPKFAEHYDVVIGIRHGRKGAPPLRKLTALGFQILRNLILNLPFVDTQCGFKAFRRDVINTIIPDMLERWNKIKTSGAAVNAAFDIELLYLANKKNYKIAEVEVDWHHIKNTKQVKVASEAVQAIKSMLVIRWNDLTGKY